jgi:hypothetical protein
MGVEGGMEGGMDGRRKGWRGMVAKIEATMAQTDTCSLVRAPCQGLALLKAAGLARRPQGRPDCRLLPPSLDEDGGLPKPNWGQNPLPAFPYALCIPYKQEVDRCQEAWRWETPIISDPRSLSRPDQWERGCQEPPPLPGLPSTGQADLGGEGPALYSPERGAGEHEGWRHCSSYLGSLVGPGVISWFRSPVRE